MHTGRKTVAAIVATVTFALAPGAAQAATVTVTGDDGNPLAVAPGAAPTIRNMSVQVGVARSAGARLKRTVTGPDGAQVAFSPETCWILNPLSLGVDYRGNGTYTVTVQEFSDSNCAAPVGPPTAFQYNVTAGVAIAPRRVPS